MQVFDDASKKLLGTARTDESGRLSVSERWQGRLRVVFSSPGFLNAVWVVAITKWPSGGIFNSKTINAVLELPGADRFGGCPAHFSRKQVSDGKP